MTNITALDIGTRMGFACGKAGHGTIPRSGAVILKAKGEHPSAAGSNLIAWLQTQWATERPGLLVKEAQLPLQAYKNLGNAAHTVMMTAGLHAIVEAMCVRFGVRFESVADSTIRKHFIGKSRLGDRASTKAAVVQRAHTLKLMPTDCRDDNRADALATWDYAAATFGRASGGALVLFGERAA